MHCLILMLQHKLLGFLLSHLMRSTIRRLHHISQRLSPERLLHQKFSFLWMLPSFLLMQSQHHRWHRYIHRYNRMSPRSALMLLSLLYLILLHQPRHLL